MKRSSLAFTICYVIDLFSFYLPQFVFPGQNIMLSGLYKVRMDVLYDYGYAFIFLIVAFHSAYFLFQQSGITRDHLFTKIIFAAISYLLFVVLSAAIICLVKNHDFIDVTVYGLYAGLFLVAFSPITYAICFVHFIVLFFYQAH
jgi:membrane-associated HD superfamily phosphohydrolase